MSKGARRCPGFPRKLRFNWSDAAAEIIDATITVGARDGAGILAVPVGEVGSMPMNIVVGDPTGSNPAMRCVTLKFRRYLQNDPDQPSNGGQDVVVYREGAQTWRVSTPAGAASTAQCTRPDGSTEPINFAVSFTIVEP